IRGAVAVGNLRGHRVDGVDLALAAMEQGAGHVGQTTRAGVTKMLRGADDGRSIPFEIVVPRDATPSFSSDVATLAYVFVARVLVGDVEEVAHTIPVAIGRYQRDRGHEGDDPANPVEPAAIGLARWRGVWEEVGLKHDLEMHPRKLELVGALSGC